MRGSAMRGSVLAVVLILLGALALLAAGATQSSLLELTMSSNELYRLRAVTAADIGVAEVEATLATSAAGVLPPPRTHVTVPGADGDEFDVVTRDGGADARLAALSGGARNGRHYTVAATGRSRRGAQARVESGVRVVRNADGALLAVEREYWLRRDVD